MLCLQLDSSHLKGLLNGSIVLNIFIKNKHKSQHINRHMLVFKDSMTSAKGGRGRNKL